MVSRILRVRPASFSTYSLYGKSHSAHTQYKDSVCSSPESQSALQCFLTSQLQKSNNITSGSIKGQHPDETTKNIGTGLNKKFIFLNLACKTKNCLTLNFWRMILISALKNDSIRVVNLLILALRVVKNQTIRTRVLKQRLELDCEKGEKTSSNHCSIYCVFKDHALLLMATFNIV